MSIAARLKRLEQQYTRPAGRVRVVWQDDNGEFWERPGWSSEGAGEQYPASLIAEWEGQGDTIIRVTMGQGVG